jgi:hypothetical protein
MDEMIQTKTGPTHHRHVVAMKDKAFDLIRNLPILETRSAHFLKVLELGTVSTNVYLRRIHGERHSDSDGGSQVDIVG